MMSGDLPLACAPAIEPLVRLAGRSPLVAIVGDRRRVGTNALLCAPPDVIPVCFGPDSFQRHVAACGRDVALRELQRRLPAVTAPAFGALRELLTAGGKALAQ